MTNYRILVIDDVLAIHDDFRKILLPEAQSHSYQNLDEINSMLTGKMEQQKQKLPPFVIDFAAQGEEGVALVQRNKARNNPYAVVFVDVQMPPGIDGVETIEQIWKIDPEIQCVICTAHAKYSWQDYMNKFGENDQLYVVKKPFDKIEIIQLAISLTKKWNLHRAINEHKTKNEQDPKSIQSKNSLQTAIEALNKVSDKLKNNRLQ